MTTIQKLVRFDIPVLQINLLCTQILNQMKSQIVIHNYLNTHPKLYFNNYSLKLEFCTMFQYRMLDIIM
jgi:hypothetical protein